jgi:hypothetical protein
MIVQQLFYIMYKIDTISEIKYIDTRKYNE